MTSDTNDAAIYRARPISVYSFSKSEAVISFSDGSQVKLLQSPLASLLLSCTAFKSLSSHARTFWSKTEGFAEKIYLINSAMQFLLNEGEALLFRWPPVESLLERVLEIFLKKGFLIERKDFLLGGTAANVIEPSGSSVITTVAFVTCDRVASLIRSVSSYIENAKDHGRAVEFAIFDDSMNRLAIDGLKELKAKYGATILYAGRTEKEQFAKSLSSRGIPQNVADFCLFGLDEARPTFGANHNASLLHTTGELFVGADDDTICRIFKPPTQQEGIRCGSPPGFEDIWWCSNLDQAMDQVSSENIDLLKIHEEALTPDVQTILRRLVKNNEDVKLEAKYMDARMMDLISSGKAKTVCSLTGLIGDSGMDDPTYFLFASDESRQRLFGSEKDFLFAFESRQIIKTQDRLTIHERPGIMTTLFGLDHRDLLPPFFPIYRSEDALFGKMVNTCVPGAFCAYLPWVVLHTPAEPRKYMEPQEFSGIVQPCDFISYWADAVNLGSANLGTKERLEALGMCLKELGSFSRNTFRSHLRRIRTVRLLETTANFQWLLDKYPRAPAYWKNYLKSRMSICQGLIGQADDGIPRKIVEEFGGEGSLEHFQNVVFLYGELLIWWPEIIAITRELKKNGCRLGQEV